VPRLILQQFDINLLWHNAFYSPSLDLASRASVDLPTCEIDFGWLIPRPYPDKTIVILGECKDRGGKGGGTKDKGSIDGKDIDHLRWAADALPRKRFETFIVLARLSPFTMNEVPANS
jgi:hypothetical protein